MFNAKRRRKDWICGLILVGLFLQSAGCGTILYPERKGQPAGQLDPKVVALDAVGLLLFFIPGVIAFAVDFNNGTIYLPPGSHASTKSDKSGWAPVRMSSKSPTADAIELAVLQKTGKFVYLKPGHYRATQLQSLDELESVNIDQQSLAMACEATDVRFRAQSN